MYKAFCVPVLAPLAASRKLAGIMFAIAVVQAGFTISGYGLWNCPVQSIIGLPCPGCGTSRGIVSLFTGHWREAIQFHLFSPLILAAIIGLGVCSLLSGGSQKKAVQIIAGVERRTGISFLIIIGMFAIWVFRVVACVSSRMDYQSLTMNTIGR